MSKCRFNAVIYIYYIERDEHGVIIKETEIEPSCTDIGQHPAKLNCEDEIYIRMSLPECWPVYKIKIIKYDYVEITAYLGYNGRLGGVSLIDKKVKYGWKAILYYLCL